MELPIRSLTGVMTPFDYLTITREEDSSGLGFVPHFWYDGERNRVFMVPVAELNDVKLARIKRVALLHWCYQMRYAQHLSEIADGVMEILERGAGGNRR